jgi:UDP-sugar transporter A1/2/3
MADMKQLSLVIMCVQNGATPLILRWAMTGEAAAARFDSTQAVLCQEFLKVLMSMGLLLAEEQWVFGSLVNVLHSEAIGRPKETLKLAVPAVLYFILNVCLQLAAAELPAAVFQVAYQGKTLVVALFSVILLSKRLSRIQWLAIMLLGLGLACVQLGRNSESKVTASTHEQSVAKGLIIVLVGCVCSGLAGVYFEKIMKGSPGSKAPSMWLKNIQLAGFSCLIGCLQQISKLILGAESRPFMYGFTPGVWLMIFNNAIGGLCVAIVIKYADNILKGFATGVDNRPSVIISVYSLLYSVGQNRSIVSMTVFLVKCTQLSPRCGRL